jgi:ubiquinone/menaquinone biosynthesis C-methylase UbiE
MTNELNYDLATGFRNVDRSDNLNRLMTCLSFMEDLPSFMAYKRKTIDRLYLESGNTVADFGCGLGTDLPKLAQSLMPGGEVFGIDLSEKLLQAAKRSYSDIKGVQFVQADIHHVPIESHSVDGVRVDRVLQHVENPQGVIKEMVRVLKPGGWLVCAEPDWSTFVIDTDDDDVLEIVQKKWSSSFRNPYIGRQLLRRIRSEKLQNIWSEGFVLLTDGLNAVDIVFDIYRTLDHLQSEDNVPQKQLTHFVERLKQRDAAEGLTASVTIFLAGGQKI